MVFTLRKEHEGNKDYHNDYYYIGAIIALSTALFLGVTNITINYCHKVNPVILLWWAGIGLILFSLVEFIFDPNSKMLSYHIVEISYLHWIAYFSIGFLGSLGKFTFVLFIGKILNTEWSSLTEISSIHVFYYYLRITLLEIFPCFPVYPKGRFV